MPVTETWLSDTLCALGDEVRIERGPQVVEMDCVLSNLDDAVTPVRYKPGRRDAAGRLIQPQRALDDLRAQLARLPAAGQADTPSAEHAALTRRIAEIEALVNLDQTLGRPCIADGDPMRIVDDKARHKAYVWKVYEMQSRAEIDHKTGAAKTVARFMPVAEVPSLEKALDRARKLAKGKRQ